MRLGLFVVISLFLLFCIVHSFKEKIDVRIAKSEFPSWDLLEYTLEKENSFFKKFRFESKRFDTYTDVLESFVKKDTELATLTICEALIAYKKLNKDIQIILLLDYTIGSDGIIAQNDIKYLSDLKNKTIGLEYATISHFTLAMALERSGLKESDVSIFYENSNNLNKKFLNNQINAFSTYDPFLYNLSQKEENYNIIFSSEEIPLKICDVLVAHKDFVIDNPHIIENIRKAWFTVVNSPNTFQLLKQYSKYKDQNYIDNIKNNIYIAGKLENKFAFGTQENPGYLYSSLTQMSKFLNNNVFDSKLIFDDDILCPYN